MQSVCLVVALAAFAAYGGDAAAPNALSWRPHSDDDVSNMISGLANEIDYASAPEAPRLTRKQGALLKKASRQQVAAKKHHVAAIPPPATKLDSYLGEMGGSKLTNKLEFTTHWKAGPKAKVTPASKPVESNIYLRDLETGHMDAPEDASAAPPNQKVAARKLSVPAPTVPVSGPLREAETLADELEDSSATAPALTAWEQKRSHSASLVHTNSYLDSVGMTMDDESMADSTSASSQRLKASNPYLKALASKEDEVKIEVQEALRRPDPKPQVSNPYLSSIVSDKDYVVLTGA